MDGSWRTCGTRLRMHIAILSVQAPALMSSERHGAFFITAVGDARLLYPTTVLVLGPRPLSWKVPSISAWLHPGLHAPTPRVGDGVCAREFGLPGLGDIFGRGDYKHHVLSGKCKRPMARVARKTARGSPSV